MRRRLLAVVLATTTLVVVAFAIPLGALVRSVARDRAISAAERDAAALAPVLAITADAELIEAAVDRTTLGTDGRVAVILPDGTVIGDRTRVPPEALDVARDGRRAFTVAEEGGVTMYAPVITGSGDVTVTRARVPGERLDAGVSEAWAALAAVAAGLVLAAAVVADRLARSLTREATSMAETARALAGGDPNARAVAVTTRELADAANALNLLAGRIDSLRAAERERVADLSHRLRTPLTALRLDADRAGDPDVAAGVDRLELAVTELIHTARRPLHDSPVGERTDLVASVRQRVEYWSALADDDGRPWSCDLPDASDGQTMVALADDELQAAIDALIGNVFTHTPDGTRYSVAVVRDHESVTLIVEDAGPGIGDDVDPRTRGRTGGASRSTGLGLDIARSAAEAGGGEMRTGSSELGGARVELRFPAR